MIGARNGGKGEVGLHLCKLFDEKWHALKGDHSLRFFGANHHEQGNTYLWDILQDIVRLLRTIFLYEYLCSDHERDRLEGVNQRFRMVLCHGLLRL